MNSGRLGNVEINITLVYRIHIDLGGRLWKFTMPDSLQVFCVNTTIVLDNTVNYKDQTTEDFLVIAPLFPKRCKNCTLTVVDVGPRQ